MIPYNFNEQIITAIISLLKGYIQASEGITDATRRKIDTDSYKYLISQCIRQYQVPISHYFTSEEAMKLWNKLTNENIDAFPGAKAYFTCDNIKEGSSVLYSSYKGSEKDGTEMVAQRGKIINFNDVFHYDHIVPVKNIFEAIIELKNPTDKDISEILDKMYICRILKGEDRILPRTAGRGLDYKQVIEGIYREKEIYVFGSQKK